MFGFYFLYISTYIEISVRMYSLLYLVFLPFEMKKKKKREKKIVLIHIYSDSDLGFSLFIYFFNLIRIYLFVIRSYFLRYAYNIFISVVFFGLAAFSTQYCVYRRTQGHKHLLLSYLRFVIIIFAECFFVLKIIHWKGKKILFFLPICDVCVYRLWFNNNVIKYYIRGFDFIFVR